MSAHVSYLRRTSMTFRLIPLLAGLEALNLLYRGLPWRGDLLWSVDSAGGALILMGPVIAGAVAWEVGTTFRPGRAEIDAATPRPRLASLACVATTMLLVTAVHLGAVAVTLALSVRSGAAPGIPVAALVSQVVGLAFFIALGFTCGALFGRRFAPVVGVVGSALLQSVIAGDSTRFAVLKFGGATSPLLGYRLDATFVVIQVAVVLVLVGLLLSVRCTALTGAHRSVSGRTTATVLGAVLLLTSAWSTGPTRRLATAEAPARTCSEALPVVCTFAGHRRLADDVTDVAQRVQSAMMRSGVDPQVIPALFVELAGNERSQTPAAWTFAAPLAALGGAELSAFALLQDLTVPKHCDALFALTPPSDDYFDAQFEVALLVAGAAGIELPRSMAAVGPTPSAMSRGEAERVSAVLHDFRRCQLTSPGARP